MRKVLKEFKDRQSFIDLLKDKEVMSPLSAPKDLLEEVLATVLDDAGKSKEPIIRLLAEYGAMKYINQFIFSGSDNLQTLDLDVTFLEQLFMSNIKDFRIFLLEIIADYIAARDIVEAPAPFTTASALEEIYSSKIKPLIDAYDDLIQTSKMEMQNAHSAFDYCVLKCYFNTLELMLERNSIEDLIDSVIFIGQVKQESDSEIIERGRALGLQTEHIELLQERIKTEQEKTFDFDQLMFEKDSDSVV